MKYFCCDSLRRQAVKDHAALNGIAYLEVLDDPVLPNDLRQRTLYVHFIKAEGVGDLTRENLRIEGGRRIKGVAVEDVSNDPSDLHLLIVEVDRPGDFSTYTLRVVVDAENLHPPDGFDPILSAVDFSFKAGCPTEFDCRQKRVCPPTPLPTPDIDYLAKDFASFRRLMLDRMAVWMPRWKERSPADMGIALVELLAYVGDHLSYQQDAVATEAYLDTARKRISVRRHARLVDYFMHDGCNARTWVQVQVSDAHVMVAAKARILTRVPELEDRIPSAFLAKALDSRPEVFETLQNTMLYQAHNKISFYTWGQQRCCLPKGATRATLCDDMEDRLRLCPGDVLIFEERIDPDTGRKEDANPAHRHAVRLTHVSPEAIVAEDLKRTPKDPVSDKLFQQPIVEIEWAAEDALPFPLCVSATSNSGDDKEVSVALGNIVLADHGLTMNMQPPGPESIGTVPEPALYEPQSPEADRCMPRTGKPLWPRFRPQLKNGPLTQAAPQPFADEPPGQFKPAAVAMQYAPHNALPEIVLHTGAQEWHPKGDLLNSGPQDRHFVVEVESDETAFLRFGDGRFGMRPDSGLAFTATYRVGNGARGNVGAEAFAHIVSNDSTVERVRNPMPAQGGVEPESMEDVRQRAPSAFRTQERAVTPDDYAEVSERNPEVQKAAATFRWTGSWHTVFVTTDRLGGPPVDDAFEKKMRRHIERYRMAGHDLEIDAPRYVPLEIDMGVCVKSEYFRSDVKAALLDVFSSGVRPNGQRGFFHPDNFSFGQAVYLSRIYSAAMAVDGVASVEVTKFQRWNTPDDDALQSGSLALGRIEIARLDNDPNFPENGVLRVNLEGGK
jgi:hypothetical protein